MNNKLDNIYKIAIMIILLIIAVQLIGKENIKQSINLGNSFEANKSIVTASSLPANKDLVKLGAGTLDKVVITAAGAGTFELYDATTTDATLRTITATSSLTKLASFPANAAVGTYDLNVGFSQGLIIAFVGAQGTTTTTYK